MPDLLTHVLLAYAGASALHLATDRVPARVVPVAMVGAAFPDVTKLYLLVPPERVGAWLGVPLSYWGWHTLGGVLVATVGGAMLFPAADRRRVALALFGGGVTHLVLDSLIVRADGLAPQYLYPFTWWEPPAGMLYLSSDVWPSLVALALAATAFAARYRAARTPTDPATGEAPDVRL